MTAPTPQQGAVPLVPHSPATPAAAPERASAARPLRAVRKQAPRATGAARTLRWKRRYAILLVTADAAVAGAAGVLAWVLRFGASHLAYLLFSVAALPLIWVVFQALARAYDPRFLFIGPEEYQRTLLTGAAVTSAVAVVSYGAKLEVSRGYLALALPGAVVLDLTVRYAIRKWMHRGRVRSGRFMQRVMAVGHEQSIVALARELHRHRYHGMQIVGACLPTARPHQPWVEGIDVPVHGSFADVATAVDQARADTVAVLSCPELQGAELQRLAWELERSSVDLLVAPALIDVAGPRTTIRPVDGLALVHVDHPTLSGGRRVAKELIDRAGAFCILLLISPLLAAIGLAIRLTSPGPALFRQTRIGRDGEAFTVLKFRSMYMAAEERVAELRSANEHDGVLFKMRDDPRVTPLGRFLRRYSLDELPQLFNVLGGSMSLVGPRPPLPSEVAQYPSDMYRRLVVKPGMTGLWQVSGRSDLSWDETVRIDLRYVENWSLALDAMILWRTLFAVVRSRGAY
ncbi:sugar transferase [Streptomyces sp. DSM 44917]|uniref:Sugar transferase n=1 Tax=Streptomyces boetiae TaxID=3075541 RepID=A0ABU2L5C0_9ACTN|nr:sugar transferase [Streptomyces sp. DSM 44917]MDT0306769.1 sugar transferase [Streptomyces sp. DSM 44917]